MLGRSFLTAALVATATATCYDDTSWFASDLETCDDYAVQAYCNAAGNTGPGWDPIWGPIVEYADANGKVCNHLAPAGKRVALTISIPRSFLRR